MKRWLAFFSLSIAVFWLAFGPLGRTLSDLWSSCFNWFTPPGLLGALWAVTVTILGLLPQILILFSFFYFLENSDFGFPLHIIMGFGCTTVAASTVTNKRSAIMLSFIPCSAKAPVVLLLFGGVLRLNFLIIFLLYIGCIVTGMVVCRFFNESQISVPKVSRQRTDKRFFVSILANTFQFFRRISGTVLIAAAILYFLKSYTFGLKQATTFDQSMLSWICSMLSPLFIPIGLGNPAVIAALAFGMLGKELAAASIAVFASSTSLILSTAAPFGFTTASLVSFVIFFMLYPPCIPAIKAIAAQTNRRTATLSIAVNFAVAYILAFIFYIIAILVI